MNRYGERYLGVREFIEYCRGLKVRTDEQELEYYEKTGVLLPAARVIYPDEYFIQTRARRLSQNDQAPTMDKWPELQKLTAKSPALPKDYVNLTNDELMHIFDREMDQNPYLFRPTQDGYKTWNSYATSMQIEDGQQIQLDTAKHYYHYWQVYHLHFLQRYPDLYENRILLEQIPEETKTRLWLPRTLDLSVMKSFKGMASSFNILSFWIILYSRERGRAFAPIPPVDYVRYLDASQFQALKDRLRDDALVVKERFHFTVDDLFGFLYELIELRNDYQEHEHHKLAEELESDINYVAGLIRSLNSVERDDVANELGKRYTHFARQSFRHLDIDTKERDDAFDLLKTTSDRYGSYLTVLKISGGMPSFSETEINELLDYCKQEGLSILINSFSRMIATSDEFQDKYRRVTRYTNLKNSVTGFEYLLKNIVDKNNIASSKNTLIPLLKALMDGEAWWTLFDENYKLLKKDDAAKEFYDNFIGLINNVDLQQSETSYWARLFLITYLARNLAVHTYPNEDWFYGSMFSELTYSVACAILYTWRLAKLKAWV